MLAKVPRLPICVGVMVVVLLVGVVVARPSLPADPPYAPPYSPPSYKQGRPYSFRYGVKDDYAGADYGQDETSDGHLVKGSYFVALPDGRLQTVKYQADHVIGYVADVEFDGDAQHPIAQYGGPITFKPSSRPS